MKNNLQILLFALLLAITLLLRPLQAGREEQAITLTEPPTPQEFLKTEVANAGLTDRDFSILSAIAFCESTWEQRYSTGEVKVSNGNIGLFQINRTAHEEEYTLLGLDPFDEYKNIKYAIILYKRNGIRDWEQWSGHCFIPRLAGQGIILK